MNKHHRVLVIGGPDAGKSNYIGRLWLAIKDGGGRLRRGRLPTDLDYLEMLAQQLLKGEFVPHTPNDVSHPCSVPFVASTTNGEIAGELIVPDCSGEKWLSAYSRREWEIDWEDAIAEECGCLVFVRADSPLNVNPLDWISCTALLGKPAAEIHPDPKQAPPTQILLVDWLQCLRRVFTDRVGGNFRPRVGVVVAAWDLVPADQQDRSPTEYIGSNFPLFHQYMESNSDLFDIRTFGISIVGGNLVRDERFTEQYLNGNPHQAGYVVHDFLGSTTRDADLTLPVVWAMGLGSQ